MSECEVFDYGESEVSWLGKRDPVLGAFISKRGRLMRRIYPDAFAGLSRAIIGQQISARAHEAIWQKFTGRFGQNAPGRIACANPDALRQCGISRHKAGYLIGVAREFAEGRLSHELLASYEDDALINRLVALPGVGRWTAEMLLIFTFKRKNVMSFGDLGIRRGLENLYGYAKVTRKEFDSHFLDYSPVATVASLYLWEAAAPGPQN